MHSYLRGARKLTTLFGFPLFVHFTFLILAGLFVIPNFGHTPTAHFAAIMWLPALFIGITVHELGHAVAIRRYKYGNSQILLWGMGGLCIGRGKRRPLDGLKISLAGPLFGLILGLPFIPLYFFDLGPVLNNLVYAMLFINIGWSVMNLLPIFPLDGGQALYYGLRQYGKKTSDKAARVSGLVGMIVLVPIIITAILFQEYFLIFLALFIGHSAWQAWRYGHAAMQL